MSTLFRATAGRSLLELITVMAILSAISALALSQLVPGRELYRLRGESEKLSLALDRLWLLASAQHQSAQLQLNSSGYTLLSQQHPFEQHTLPKTFSMSGPGKVWFTSRGVARPATFQLRASHWQCEIVLSLRGRARIECMGR